jgi:hypothetical protein
MDRLMETGSGQLEYRGPRGGLIDRQRTLAPFSALPSLALPGDRPHPTKTSRVGFIIKLVTNVHSQTHSFPEPLYRRLSPRSCHRRGSRTVRYRLRNQTTPTSPKRVSPNIRQERRFRRDLASAPIPRGGCRYSNSLLPIDL